MKRVLFFMCVAGLTACGGDSAETVEVKPETMETLTKEEAYQQELYEIDAELDSLMNELE